MDGVPAPVGVEVGVSDGVAEFVAVAVFVAVGVLDGVAVFVTVGVLDGVAVPLLVQDGYLKEPTRVCHRSPPGPRYWPVNQKVQSSTGSTLMLE